MTDLAETIERVERGIQHWSLDGHLSKADAEALLATARCVQAMDAAGSEVIDAARQAIGAADSWGTSIGTIGAADLRALLDLASDQSAARAEVERLQGEVRLQHECRDHSEHNEEHWLAETKKERSRADRAEALAGRLSELCKAWEQAADCITSNEHTPEALARYGKRLNENRDGLQKDLFEVEARVRQLETERSDVRERAERMRDGNRESAAKYKGTRAQIAQHGADVAQYILGGFKP